MSTQTVLNGTFGRPPRLVPIAIKVFLPCKSHISSSTLLLVKDVSVATLVAWSTRCYLVVDWLTAANQRACYIERPLFVDTVIVWLVSFGTKVLIRVTN